MNVIKIQNYHSPVGELTIGSFEEKLCFCDWRYRKMRSVIDARLQKGLKAEFITETSEVIERTISQLDEYFRKERKEFDISLLFVGTDFQKSIWQALLQVPYGKTLSYMELSKKIGNPKAVRAVAAASGANAISIIVPCHRIIGSDGELVGYAGGLPVKKKLLAIESSELNSQLDLF